MTHDQERALLGHYEAHLNYWSPLSNYRANDLAKLVGAELSPPLLDLGCGDGRLAHQLDFAITGVDMSPSRLALAQIAFPGSSWRFSDVYTWLETDQEQYQTITAFDVLEHLEEPERIVCLARARLLEGGAFVATIPLDMDIDEHLQLYADAGAVRDALAPDELLEIGTFVVCRWGAQKD